ncbi:hypothetical protein [Halioxenophilus aromaticivorans]|uniref:Uncharacterized protein n=1 Tax=Halioxenophilus aromaticivorans TaxID=1306992 RepID=A0AAV3U9Q1_9ALTE
MLNHYLAQKKQCRKDELDAYESLIENVSAARNMGAWCSHQAEKPKVLLSSAALGALYGLAGGKATFAKAYATRKIIVQARRTLLKFYMA